MPKYTQPLHNLRGVFFKDFLLFFFKSQRKKQPFELCVRWREATNGQGRTAGGSAGLLFFCKAQHIPFTGDSALFSAAAGP